MTYCAAVLWHRLRSRAAVDPVLRSARERKSTRPMADAVRVALAARSLIAPPARRFDRSKRGLPIWRG